MSSSPNWINVVNITRRLRMRMAAGTMKNIDFLHCIISLMIKFSWSLRNRWLAREIIFITFSKGGQKCRLLTADGNVESWMGRICFHPPPAVIHFCVKNILLPPSATVFGLTLELLWLLLIHLHPSLLCACACTRKSTKWASVAHHNFLFIMHASHKRLRTWIIIFDHAFFDNIEKISS